MLKRFLLAAALLAFSPVAALAQTGPYTPQSVPDFVQSGQLTYVNGAVTLVLNGQSSCTVNIIGSWTGTISFQGTSDNYTWQNLQLVPYPGGSSTSSTTQNNLYVGACVGLSQFRVFSSSWTTGTAYITLHGANGSGASIGGAGGGGGGGNSTIVNPVDVSGYVETHCMAGCGGGSGAPLPGNSSTAGGANQAIAVQGYDGSANVVPLQETNGWLKTYLAGGVALFPFSGGSTGVATATNQTVGIAAYNGTTMDSVRSFTFAGTPGWIASASTMYDPTTALNASVNAAGTTGTNAVATQGITGGVPMNVACASGTQCHVNVDNAVSTTQTNGPGQNTSGTGQFQPMCDQSAPISVSASGDFQLVALTGGKQVHVCAYNLLANGSTAATLEYGTGSNCATGKTSITGAYPLTAQTGLSAGSGLGQLFAAPVSNAVCINNGSAQTVSGLITYGVWYNGRFYALHSLADLKRFLRGDRKF